MSKNSLDQPLEQMRVAVQSAADALDELAKRARAAGLRMRFLISIESPSGTEQRWTGEGK